MAILDGWIKNRAGRVVARRATDFDTTTLPAGLVVLRLEYADSRKHLSEIAADTALPSSVQVALTLKQADALIASLTDKVSRFRKVTSQSGALN